MDILAALILGLIVGTLGLGTLILMGFAKVTLAKKQLDAITGAEGERVTWKNWRPKKQQDWDRWLQVQLCSDCRLVRCQVRLVPGDMYVPLVTPGAAQTTEPCPRCGVYRSREVGTGGDKRVINGLTLLTKARWNSTLEKWQVFPDNDLERLALLAEEND